MGEPGKLNLGLICGTAAGPMIEWVPSERLPRRPEFGELY